MEGPSFDEMSAAGRHFCGTNLPPKKLLVPMPKSGMNYLKMKGWWTGVSTTGISQFGLVDPLREKQIRKVSEPQPLLVSRKVLQYTSNLYGSTAPIRIPGPSGLLSLQ